MSFAYVSITSPLHDERARQAILAGYTPALAAVGGVGAADEDVDQAAADQPLFYFVLTGGTERTFRELQARRGRTRPGEPVWLIAHPFQNSLPASLEILARVKQDGGDGRIFFLSAPDDGKTLADIARTAELARSMGSLSRLRMGRIGASSDWLIASSQSDQTVKDTWGVQVVTIPIDELHRLIRNEGLPEDGPEFAFFKEAQAIREASTVEIAQSVAIYRALRRLVATYRLDALTLRCFDLVLEEKATGCFALSRLNDEGVIAGCEGDIPAALALLWARQLTGVLGWMSNPARVDVSGGRLLLAHCTVPRSLVGAYTVRSHFESSLGVGIAGVFAPGPVTLVRIGGRELDRLWVTEGEIIDSPHEEGLCRTQIEVRLAPEALDRLLRDPLGNHIVVVEGRHESSLTEAFSMLRQSNP